MTASKYHTVGIIGGLGWLGSALTNSALLSEELAEVKFIVSSRRATATEMHPRVTFTQDNQALVDASDLVILSVRPQDWASITLNLRDKPLMSFMAGISSHALSEKHHTKYVIRALPNGACSNQQSYTPWYCTSQDDPTLLDFIAKLLRCMGHQDQYDLEDHIEVLTAISGAGPAYPALLAQALQQSAIKLGIPQDKAQRAVNATLLGSGAAFKDLSNPPANTVSVFEEYQGTTAAGLAKMKQCGFVEAVEAGVEAAYDKAIHFNSPAKE